MLLKRFYINLIVRLLLILVNMLLQAFAIRDLIDGQLLFTFIVLSGILILQVVLLFLYVKKTNRLLTRLVLSVSNQDFSQLSGSDSAPHKELQKALNAIILQYQSVYMEKESQTFLMHHLVQAIPAGILVVNQEGFILHKNIVIEKLLDLSGVNSLQEIQKRQPDFYKKVLEPGNTGNFVFEHTRGGERIKLSLTLREFPLANKKHRIILVQDISRVVDASEVDAIQRLLRILTHEIMNSLTPVHSLTETICMLMTGEDGGSKTQEEITRLNFDDILESVQAIQERTGRLEEFVTRFRSLTRMPDDLDLKAVRIRQLLDSLCNIMQTELAGTKLLVDVDDEDLEIMADAVLMEQVLINLLSNALTAISGTDQPRLELKAYNTDSRVMIQVRDNGSGIPKEKLPDIFMPFYSTKEKASGIGLSFVRQVLRLHNASIQVQSEPGKGSTFSIRFDAAV